MKKVTSMTSYKNKAQLNKALEGAAFIKKFTNKLTGRPVKTEWYAKGNQEISVQYLPFEYCVIVRG